MRLPGRRQGKLLRPRQGEGARGNGGPPAAAVDEATRRTAAWASSVADETAGDRQGEVDGRDGRGPRDDLKRTRALFDMPDMLLLLLVWPTIRSGSRYVERS